MLATIHHEHGAFPSLLARSAYRDAVLGIFPLGTQNRYERALRIPLELDGASEMLDGGAKVPDLDLGKINDDYFDKTAENGLPAVVGRTMPHGLKR